MTQEKLTPEQIADIAKTLSKEELIALILEYGDERENDAIYWAGKNL